MQNFNLWDTITFISDRQSQGMLILKSKLKQEQACHIDLFVFNMCICAGQSMIINFEKQFELHSWAKRNG